MRSLTGTSEMDHIFDSGKHVDIKLFHEELGDRKREQNSKNRAVCM